MLAIDERPAGWDGHVLLVHHNESERRRGVAAWARRGLELGGKIVYTEPMDVAADHSFLGVLEAAGVRADDAVSRGQVEVTYADPGVYSPQWQADVIGKAFADGYPLVGWSTESATARLLMSAEEHAETERVAEEASRQRPLSFLCQYPADLALPHLEDLCTVHGAGLRESLLHTHPVPGGIAVAGEVDASNARLLGCALASAAADAAGRTLVVDLSELGFLDAAGTRALLAGTVAHRQNGGRVRLRAPTRPVQRVLRILDVDREDQFVLEVSR